MKAFQEAVEARDFAAIEALLADDVVFVSPVAFTPYPGKKITIAILKQVIQVLEGFTYERVLGEEGARDQGLVFTATVQGKSITGCDFLRLNDEGLISEFMVMVRPLSAAQALAEEMGARFEQIKADAAS